VKIHAAVDVDGKESVGEASTQANRVLLYAYLNAASESGYANPIASPIKNLREPRPSNHQRLVAIAPKTSLNSKTILKTDDRHYHLSDSSATLSLISPR